MGRVTTEATFENIHDLWAVKEGLRPADQARKVVIPDALVDTGATLLSLPPSVIQQLGLSQTGIKRVRSSSGLHDAPMYEAVRLTIRGRDCTMDVLEVPEGTPALIGQIPLEHLDLVVDPRNCTLTGNPRHGGEHMYEMY